MAEALQTEVLVGERWDLNVKKKSCLLSEEHIMNYLISLKIQPLSRKEQKKPQQDLLPPPKIIKV